MFFLRVILGQSQTFGHDDTDYFVSLVIPLRLIHGEFISPRTSKTIATLAMSCKPAAHCFKYDERNVPQPITVFVIVVAKTSELMRENSHHSSVVLKHYCYRIFTKKSKSK